MSQEYTYPVRVYYEDTDAAGIVYHARYLHFAERARTEALREAGYDHRNLLAEHDVVFAVHSCQMRFARPARLDDALEVKSKLAAVSGVRMIFDQRVFNSDQLVCQIEITLAVLNSQLRPRRLPKPLADAFAGINLR